MVNVLQSLLLTDGPEGLHCVRTTTYHAFALFKAHRSNTAVRVETDASSEPGISVSASKSGNTLILTVVNPRLDADTAVACTLRGVRAVSGAAQILHHPDLNAANTFDSPDRIIPQALPVSVEPQRIRIELPRLSVATVTLQVAN
jgi:alpha-N-arabinofuranosidase